MFSSELIKKFEAIPTPFYYYDLDVLRETLNSLRQFCTRPGYYIHYALKANANRKILSLILDAGLGADCVSGNEIQRALEVGFAPERIVFAGVGKTDREIQLALDQGIQCLNCESLQELEVISALAQARHTIAPVALRINPALEANTHEYITTGRDENKFGIHLSLLTEAVSRVSRLPALNLVGLHFHIGSQITDLNVFEKLCAKVNTIQHQLQNEGVSLPHLNLGGGLGVDYYHPDKAAIPNFKDYFSVFEHHLKPLPGQQIHFELGRAIVAQCGCLITRVLYTKAGNRKKFVITDAGMTELLRPALYHAYHKIENLTGRGPLQTYDVVGPICESSDFLGKDVPLPETRRGDLLAVHTTGAYAEVMASRYNLRDPAGVVYSDEL